jgi:hypothetical protein
VLDNQGWISDVIFLSAISVWLPSQRRFFSLKRVRCKGRTISGSLDPSINPKVSHNLGNNHFADLLINFCGLLKNECGKMLIVTNFWLSSNIYILLLIGFSRFLEDNRIL